MCTFWCSPADEQSDANNTDNKKPNGKENTRVEPRSEKNVMGRKFWTEGYYVGTVGEHGNEDTITKYIRNQGRNMEEYKKIHDDKQLDLFESM